MNHWCDRKRISWLVTGHLSLATFLLVLTGCAHQQTRFKAEDDTEAHDKEFEVKTIGDLTTVANAEPVPISGVGLVVGLEGTGGSAPPSSYRTLLERQLARKNYDHIKELLASPNVSMVLVSALIPPGAHKGDPLDIQVTLPEGCRTTSLRGGYLQECDLYDYDNKKNLDPSFDGPNATLIGHVLARAEGPLLVGFGEGDESAKLREGRIWGGGHSRIERPFVLVLNEDQARAAVAKQVADRVNDTFAGPFHGTLTDMAVAETGSVVYLKVPQQYRLNLPHYLRVVRLIPLEESPPQKEPYRRRLEEHLLDPAHTVTAALRLEALGRESIEPLKKGLKSPHPLVRFCAAESLAYLGDPSCGEELARLAEQQPALRAYCLTAMGSLDEAICHIKLRELLASNSAETRYGAFRALRALDEREPAVAGEELNDSFWLHHVAPDAPPLVHMTSNRRAEIVLFGEGPSLRVPFSILAGEFTITAGRDDDRCTISRFSVQHGTSRRQCSLQLDDVLHTLADLGGTYPDAVEMLRQAANYQSLTCALAIDALPQATSVYDLAKGGAGQKPDLLEGEAEIRQAQSDFSSTPTLFDKGSAGHSISSVPRDGEEAKDEDAARDGRKVAGSPPL